jgi:uncharacterized glyoxalase superfamily protein PhnB
MAGTAVESGVQSLAPYLVVQGADGLIDFLARAFGGVEAFRAPGPDGRIVHAEVMLGAAKVMLGDAADEGQIRNAAIHLYVNDTDTFYQRALKAGATSLREPADQVYGDRSAGVRDPFGNVWWLATCLPERG